MIFGDIVTPDGLTISIARALSLEEWTEAVEVVSGLSVASPWWIGDLLALGALTYGESYAQGIPEGISPATLRGYQWVAERVLPANRKPGLSWSHHRAVSALPPVEQTLLLDQAEAEGWSVRELASRAKGQEPEAKAVGYYVVGRVVDEGGEGNPWSLIGVFHGKKRAVLACGDDHCFVAPIALNEVRSVDGIMRDSWYPALGEPPE